MNRIKMMSSNEVEHLFLFSEKKQMYQTIAWLWTILYYLYILSLFYQAP